MPEFQNVAPNGTLAALSIGIGIKESKTKYMKINRNISNLGQYVITDGQLF
jgi:hypothetical protein